MSDIAVDDVAILQGDKCRNDSKTETEGVTESNDGNIRRNGIFSFHDEKMSRGDVNSLPVRFWVIF